VSFPRSNRPAPGRARQRADAPLSSFFERDAQRQKRWRSRRNTLVISLAIHVVGLAVLLLYAFWPVEELWSPSVKVKLFRPSQVPAPAATAPLRP